MMRAAISGRAALAVLEENGRWHSLHYNDMSRLVPRTAEALPSLLRDVRDVEWLEADSLDAVKQKLADAVDSTEGLDLVLYLLDDSLSDDTRETAALEFEDLTAYPEVIELIENVLLAHPLPAEADMVGALAACDRANAQSAKRRLTEWESLQPAVLQVWNIWRTPISGATRVMMERAISSGIRVGMFPTFVRTMTSLISVIEDLRASHGEESIGCDSELRASGEP